MARTRLGLHEPPSTLTAVATVAHRLETEGPGAVLRELSQSQHNARGPAGSSASGGGDAGDPIYDADVRGQGIWCE